jgi:virulence-associated protein VagC
MKTAKIFANGRSRAVRIPSGWLKGADEVEMYHEGDKVVLTPVRSTLGDIAKAYAKDPIHITRMKQTMTAPKRFQG